MQAKGKETSMGAKEAMHVFNESLSPNSVEISRGSNGVVTVTVKCYGETAELAATQAKSAFDKLTKQYPYSKP